ncbi:hypothetical protein JK231_05715 [Pantoea sp. JGM49]|uniref:hypothetical protein n=1 Tax=Pantoea sp. JGM49 TaxID=2799791 RepID=UPI001BAD1743|nr:hypothetical protein [Pantoea sp. JGM49]MBS0880099.1 hypothetical protein [Pantoea sp. JGM49]
MSIKPQSSNTTGRDQVDIGIKNQRNGDNCAQFAIRFFKVNGQKITTAQFAAEQFIIFIFSSLEEIYHHHNTSLSS